jgi:zinc protease
MVHHEVMPFGMPVFVAEMPRSPAAALGLWLRSGSADDPPGLGGISHFLEHLLVGPRGRAGGGLAFAVHAAGGHLNAETGADHVALHQVVPATACRRVLAALAGAVSRPDLGRRAVETERRVILEEIAWEEADPWRLLWRRLMEATFDAHPYRRPVTGEAGTVNRISRNDLVAHHGVVCRPSNTLLVVAGGVDAREVFRDCRARRRWPDAGAPSRQSPPRVIEPPRRALRARAFTAHGPGLGRSRCLVAVAFRTVPALDGRAPALEALAAVLGHGREARLSRALSEVACGARRVSVCHAGLSDSGLLVVRAEAGTDAAPEVVRRVFREARALADDGPSPEEMEGARRRVEVERAMAGETAESVARCIGALAALGGGWAAGLQSPIAAVAVSEVARAAREFMVPERATVVACVAGPQCGLSRTGADGLSALEAEMAGAAGLASVAEEDLPWAAGSRGAGSRPGTERDHASRRSLPGGGVFIACRRAGSPVAAAALAFRGGFVDEPASLSGGTYLLQRVLAGGESAPSGQASAPAIRPPGVGVSSACDRDGFGVGAATTPSLLPVAVRHLLRVAWPALARDDLLTARAGVLAELDEIERDPVRRALRLTMPLVFGEDPYGRPLRGTRESLLGISIEDLKAWHREVCAPSRLIACVAGDLDADAAAAVIGRVAAGMGGGADANAPGRGRGERPAGGPGPAACPGSGGGLGRVVTAIERTDLPRSAVAVGFRAPAGGRPESAAMRVLCAALSMRGGRLWRELRERRPHAYAVHATHLALARGGALVIHAALRPGQEGRAVDAVLGVARSVASGGLGSAELAAARAHAAGVLALSRERCSVLAAGCAAAEAAGFGREWFERLPGAVSDVGSEDAASVAAEWLDPEKGFACVTTSGRP